MDILYYDDSLLNVFRIRSVLTSWRFITLIPIREDEVLCIFYFCEAHLLFLVVRFKLLTLVPLLHIVVLCVFFPLQKSFGSLKADLSFVIKGEVQRSELPEVSPGWQEQVATTSILYAQTHTQNPLKKWKPVSTILVCKFRKDPPSSVPFEYKRTLASDADLHKVCVSKLILSFVLPSFLSHW